MAWSSSYFNRMLILLICLGLLFEPALLKAGGCWSKIGGPSHDQHVAGHTRPAVRFIPSDDSRVGSPKASPMPPEYQPGVRNPSNISTCWWCIISFFCCCDADSSDDGSQEGVSLVLEGDGAFYTAGEK